MMSKRFWMALCVVLGACIMADISAATAADQATQDRQRGEQFGSFAHKFRIAEAIPSLSIAIARRGEIIFTGTYGFQDHDDEEPTTTKTSYLAASITKTFTAATLLAMEADGHISLNEDFTTFSEWDSRCRRLVRSGSIFGGADLGNLVIPALECEGTISLENVLSHRVNGTPGSDFIYNPIIFGRLSNYIEEKTDRSWRDWMRHYVIDAGELQGIAAGWRDTAGADVLTHFAPPFKHVPNDSGDDDFVPSVLPNTELNASSSIIASPSALAQYGSALLKGKILPQPLLDRMWSPTAGADGTPEPYGLGWYVEDINGRKTVWHGGWWPDAYAGMIVIIPNEELVFVALGNTDGLHWDNPLNEAQLSSSPLFTAFADQFLH